MTAISRKGDIVVLVETVRTSYMHGSQPSESSERYTLVRVAKASRFGNVQAIQDMKYGTVSQLKHMPYAPRILTIGDYYEEALRASEAHPEPFTSAGAVQEALRSARTKET